MVILFAMVAAGVVLWTLNKDWKEKIEPHPPYVPDPAGAGKRLAVILGFAPPRSNTVDVYAGLDPHRHAHVVISTAPSKPPSATAHVQTHG